MGKSEDWSEWEISEMHLLCVLLMDQPVFLPVCHISIVFLEDTKFVRIKNYKNDGRDALILSNL